jgi:hypothetical protein
VLDACTGMDGGGPAWGNCIASLPASGGATSVWPASARPLASVGASQASHEGCGDSALNGAGEAGGTARTGGAGGGGAGGGGAETPALPSGATDGRRGGGFSTSTKPVGVSMRLGPGGGGAGGGTEGPVRCAWSDGEVPVWTRETSRAGA